MGIDAPAIAELVAQHMRAIGCNGIAQPCTLFVAEGIIPVILPGKFVHLYVGLVRNCRGLQIGDIGCRWYGIGDFRIRPNASQQVGNTVFQQHNVIADADVVFPFEDTV